MSCQVLTHAPRWMSKILYEPFILKRRSNSIPTIFVDSPHLTASYYREYLGFRELFRYSGFNGKSVLLQKGRNLIWVESNMFKSEQLSNTEHKFQKISIRSSMIEDEFKSLSDKVKFAKSLNASEADLKTFSILDCNGIEIVYTNKSLK